MQHRYMWWPPNTTSNGVLNVFAVSMAVYVLLFSTRASRSTSLKVVLVLVLVVIYSKYVLNRTWIV